MKDNLSNAPTATDGENVSTEGENNNGIENNENTVQNQNVVNEEVEEEIESKPWVVLPYAGKQGKSIVSDLKKCFGRYLPRNVKPMICYTGKKLGSFFHVKEKVKEEHHTDLVYEYDSTEDRNCKTKSRYVGGNEC